MTPAAVDVDRDVEFPPFPPRPAVTHHAVAEEVLSWTN